MTQDRCTVCNEPFVCIPNVRNAFQRADGRWIHVQCVRPIEPWESEPGAADIVATLKEGGVKPLKDADHVEVEGDDSDGSFAVQSVCAGCGEPWPCSRYRIMADIVAALEEEK